MDVAVRVPAGVTLCDHEEQVLRTFRARLTRQIDALDRERVFLEQLLTQNETNVYNGENGES